MSIRLEMLQVARLAPNILGESKDLVGEFLLRQINPDGGFKDRAGRSDLYYTVFGLEGLLALQSTPNLPLTTEYLKLFADGASLDFVHLCCLARCRATVASMGGQSFGAEPSEALARRLMEFRAEDGGFHPNRGARYSTIYASFLGLAACQDLRFKIPEAGRLEQAVAALRTKDGGWANERAIPFGATNSTAAAVTLLRNLSAPADPSVGDWLIRQIHPQGGFVAVPGAPIPDLLSTATALHALSGLQRDISAIREGCLDFVDTLWTNEGAFHGHWDDHHLDAEYAYYGLLALGHLSL